jgi:ATP/maltotriose-dependent transcriptional regulator MalT/DNA-binding SARP family transcriptional activator
LEVPYPSKVSLPVRHPGIVRRQRLVEELEQALLRHRLTIVSAPAGYGKTTLLYDFAQDCPQPVCWYSLDERDCDLQTFVRYFLAAGRANFPEFGPELARALQGARKVTAKEAAGLMVLAAQSVSGPYVFILDDFHYLDEAPANLIQAIEGWLYRLPSNCQAVLSGRTRPVLSIIPLMSVRQEVETISTAAFSFTCDEVVHLYRDVLGRELTLDDAQHLADLTEGWAAALVLLADNPEAGRTALSLEQMRPSGTLYQYMLLEQFEPLPKEIQQFLTGSAILRSLDKKMASQILEAPDIEDKLAYLERRNLIVKDGQQRAYHSLFRAFLISHLRAEEPARLRELNARAAEMMEGAERWEEAVYHHIQAQNWDRIVQITERVGWRLFEEGRWDTLADWLDAVPADELTAQPKLILWKARILHYLNQMDRALALLSEAIIAFEAKKEWISLAEALVTKGMCLRVKGEYQQSREALAQARSLLLKHDGPTSALTEARKELGITLSLCGEINQAIDELTAVLHIYEAQGDMYNIAHASDQLAANLMCSGRLADAALHLERARQRWLKLGNHQRLIQTLTNLGVMYFLQGDYQKSEEVTQQGLQIARTTGSERWEAYLVAGLGDIKRNTGDPPAALELYKAALEEAWSLDDAYIRIYTADAIARTYHLLGDLTACESWSRRAMAEAERRGGALELGLCSMTSGLLKRQQGELKGAVKDLETAISRLKEADARRELASAYFHLAGVYFALKRKRLSLDCLEAAARQVTELGYDHFLIVEAAKNPLLIQYAAANKIAGGYFARILKMIKSGTQPGEPAAGQAAGESGAPAVHAFGFGNLRVEAGGREVTDLEWRSEKSKEMFFFFLANRRPLRKDEIVAALWPDLPEDKTASAFHSNMYRLRKALYQECIAKDSGRYILDPRGRFSFDVQEFQEAIKEANSLPKGSPGATAPLERALALYKGPFAPDFFTEWAEALRWQMEEQYMSVLTTLAAAYNEQADYKRSAEVCQRILELDEFNEAAWFRLMSNYIQSGQVEAAKYCYNRYVQIVRDDLEEGEIPGFEQMVGEIRGGRRKD